MRYWGIGVGSIRGLVWLVFIDRRCDEVWEFCVGFVGRFGYRDGDCRG